MFLCCILVMLAVLCYNEWKIWVKKKMIDKLINIDFRFVDKNELFE